MPVSTTWTNPSAAGALDLATGAVLTEAWTDGVASDLLRLGGTTGFVCQATSAVMSSNFSTAATVYTDITGATVTLTPSGRGDVVVMYCGPAHATTQIGQVTLTADGVDGNDLVSLTAGGQVNLPITVIQRYSAPSAAAHTYKVRGKAVSGGTLVMNGTVANGVIIAMEIR